MEFLLHDPVEQAVTYQRVTFDAEGTKLRPLRLYWPSELDLMARPACDCGSATTAGTAARSPRRAASTSRSTSWPDRLPHFAELVVALDHGVDERTGTVRGQQAAVDELGNAEVLVHAAVHVLSSSVWSSASYPTDSMLDGVHRLPPHNRTPHEPSTVTTPGPVTRCRSSHRMSARAGADPDRVSKSAGLGRRTRKTTYEEAAMFTTADRRMVVTMLAEGHPVWFVAAQVRRHSRDVEAVARQRRYPDPASLRRAAFRLAPKAA